MKIDFPEGTGIFGFDHDPVALIHCLKTYPDMSLIDSSSTSTNLTYKKIVPHKRRFKNTFKNTHFYQPRQGFLIF